MIPSIICWSLRKIYSLHQVWLWNTSKITFLISALSPIYLSFSFSLATYSDSDSEEDLKVGSSQIRDYNDSDTDSLELDPELMRGGVVRTVTSSVAGASSSFTSVLGNIISTTINTQAQDRRHSGAEDFEFISQEDLDLDQDGF